MFGFGNIHNKKKKAVWKFSILINASTFFNDFTECLQLVHVCQMVLIIGQQHKEAVALHYELMDKHCFNSKLKDYRRVRVPSSVACLGRIRVNAKVKVTYRLFSFALVLVLLQIELPRQISAMGEYEICHHNTWNMTLFTTTHKIWHVTTTHEMWHVSLQHMRYDKCHYNTWNMTHSTTTHEICWQSTLSGGRCPALVNVYACCLYLVDTTLHFLVLWYSWYMKCFVCTLNSCLV